MTSCAGPYTRVFFDKSDANACERLVTDLAGQGTVERSVIPRGRGGLDDFSCDIDFYRADNPDTVWWLRLSKLLGPKKLLRQTHIFEAALIRNTPEEEEPWQGHLFASSLSELLAALAEALPRTAKGAPVDGLITKDEAHDVRIELCNGL